MMQLGFSINEILALATLVTGTCWAVWKRRTRRLGRVPENKPWWVSFGTTVKVRMLWQVIAFTAATFRSRQ